MNRLLFLACFSPLYGASLSPVNLRCEYRTAPIGVDADQPLLTWNLESSQRGQKQTFYRVIVASTPDKLSRGEGDLWDSGKVRSPDLRAFYAGRPLKSHEQCHWKVFVWDKADRPAGSSTATRWSMGILQPSDWNARWILWPDTPAASGPLPIFRKEFVLKSPVRRAIAYVSGLGQFELHVNGKKAGDSVLDPGWTNYRKTTFYVPFDVTSMLQPGQNAVSVMLGNGMYNVQGGRYIKFKGSFGPPKLIIHLRLEYADGSTGEVVSDESWKATAGPIRFSCIYGGEDYDARAEQPGWDKAGFDDAAWQSAKITDGPGGTLVSQISPPIHVSKTFTGKLTAQRVYDLGQNFSGWPVLSVRGKAGSTIKLITGELLDSRGLVTQRSSGGPTYFSYTLRGDAAGETWHPQFSYTGFRYVQVEGDADVTSIGGSFIHSSAEESGEFSCSKPLFNRIHALVDAAVRSNLQSVLTDCPHREKLGWLEVAHLMGPSILFRFNAANLYSKIVRDMREAQTDSGLVPDIAPEYTVFKDGFRDSPEWGSAYVVLPWMLYQWYGDTRSLKENLDGMARYAAHLGSTASDDIVSHGLGDWYDIGPGRPGASKLTPKGLTSTAIYYHDLDILARSAKLLGRTEDAERFRQTADRVRAAFQSKFFDSATNSYATGSQTANAMPLVLSMVPPEKRSAVLDNLVRDVRERGNKQTAGDVGYTYLLRALASGGRSDVIFDMTSRTDPPSYGAQLANGATSLTEAWDADPLSSQNHCMLGHIQEWFYSSLAGIVPDPESPGFSHFFVRPQVVGDITWVKARYQSVRGPIVSEWKRSGRRLELTISVPPGSTATVTLPGRSPFPVESGKHRFTALTPIPAAQ